MYRVVLISYQIFIIILSNISLFSVFFEWTCRLSKISPCLKHISNWCTILWNVSFT